MEQFGDAFLALLREEGDAPAPPTEDVQEPDEIGHILRQLERGMALDDVFAASALSKRLILRLLIEHLTAGGALPPGTILAEPATPSARRPAVFEQFDRLGVERLAAVYVALGGDFTYDELALLAVYYLSHT